MANKRNRNRSNKSKTTTRKKRGDGAISHSNVDTDAVVREGTEEVLRKESKTKETGAIVPRGKIGTLSNVPSSILPPPPPPTSINCSIAKQKLAKSRSHLKGVNLLRKNCIIISGLPKTEFPTIAAIENFFSRYGKIVLVVENPKGIVAHYCPRTKCLSGGSDQDLLQLNDVSSRKNDENRSVFLSYMSEKSANLALRDINSGKILSTIPDGRSKQNIVHSTFVYSPYCEKFLKGEHCRDLHCVLMHEDVKSNRNSLSPTSSSGSKSSVAKSFKESYRTPPIILKKERSNAVAESQFSSDYFKNTRSFLEVTTGVERKGIEQGNCLNKESGKENIRQQQHAVSEFNERNGEIEFGERSRIQHGNYHNGTEHSCSSTYTSDERTALDDDDYNDEEDADDQYKRKIVFQQLIGTPDSTLTKSTISSKLTLNTYDQSPNGYSRDGDNSCIESNRSMSDFCAKELFVALKKDTTSENRTLLALAFPLNEFSPFQHGDDDDNDGDNDDVDISSLQTVKMCTSPWDFQSPLQLEKDNFDTLYTNNLFHISRLPNLGADRCHSSVNKNHCSTLAHRQNLMASNSMLHTTGKRKNQNESPNKFIGEHHRFSQTSSPLSTKSTGCYPVQQQQQQQNLLFPQDQSFPPMTNYRSFPQQYRQQQNANYYPPQHLPRANFPLPYPMIGHLQPHGGGGVCHPFSNRLHPNCYNPIGQAPIFWWNRM